MSPHYTRVNISLVDAAHFTLSIYSTIKALPYSYDLLQDIHLSYRHEAYVLSTFDLSSTLIRYMRKDRNEVQLPKIRSGGQSGAWG